MGGKSTKEVAPIEIKNIDNVTKNIDIDAKNVDIIKPKLPDPNVIDLEHGDFQKIETQEQLIETIKTLIDRGIDINVIKIKPKDSIASNLFDFSIMGKCYILFEFIVKNKCNFISIWFNDIIPELHFKHTEIIFDNIALISNKDFLENIAVYAYKAGNVKHFKTILNERVIKFDIGIEVPSSKKQLYMLCMLLIEGHKMSNGFANNMFLDGHGNFLKFLADKSPQDWINTHICPTCDQYFEGSCEMCGIINTMKILKDRGFIKT